MSSNDSTESGQPLVFGVPSSTVATALRNAGLAEDAVVALLGRAIARSANPTPGPGVLGPVVAVGAAAAGQGFAFQVLIAETAPECALTYERLFVHPDFIDGVTVVQAGQTPDEIGFNARFHSIEAEFDSISRNLQTSSNCVAELRRELYLLARELEAKITEIDARLDAKGKDKDTKEGKESKEGKEGKETKEKDTKEGKDKEGKDHKDTKDKEHIEKAVAGLEKLDQIENPLLRPAAAAGAAGAATGAAAGSGRTFITLGDRPDVEGAALGDDQTSAALPTAPAGSAPAVAARAAATKNAAKKTPAKKVPAKKAAPTRVPRAKAATGMATATAAKKVGAAAKKTTGAAARKATGTTAAKKTTGAAKSATGVAAKKATSPRRRHGAGDPTEG